jgi:hypothetical protein
MFPRVISVEERVRASETFPRIRDAEKSAKEYEKAVTRKAKIRAAKLRKKEEERRERLLNGDSEHNKYGAAGTHLPPEDPIIHDPDNYFSSFKLTDDPDLLKFLPYGELSYPKLYHESSMPLTHGPRPQNRAGDRGPAMLRNYMDGLWMSGFLDAANKPKPAHVGITDEIGGHSSSTTNPPSSSANTQSQTSPHDLNPRQTGFGSDLYSKMSTSSTVTDPTALRAAKKTAAKAGNNNLSKILPPLPETTQRPQNGNRRSSASSVESNVSNTDSHTSAISAASGTLNSSNSDADASKFSSSTLRSSSLSNLMSNKRQKNLDRMLAEMMKPYEDNVKSAMKFNSKPSKLPVPTTGAPATAITFESKQLERIFNQQRKENEAATKIQYFYRWSHMIHRIRFVVVAVRMAKRIQKVIRGFLARKFVAQWFIGNTHAAVKIQSHIRKYLSNLHIVPVLMAEQHAATQIQKTIRGRLGRVKFSAYRQIFAASKIQKLWRGLLSRMHSSRQWVETLVVPMQTRVRRYIAIQLVRRRRQELNAAALMIQRQFRSWSACKKMSKSLFDREMAYRMDMVTILTAEEEFAEEKLAKIASRLSRHNYKQEATRLANDMYNKFEEIRKSENLYLDQRMQRDIVSPRAIVQGN